MRVLVISAAFPPNQSGEATNAHHVCQHLAARGLDVHVLTTEGNMAATDSTVTVHPLMRTWSWAEVPRLRRFLKRCSPDVIYLMYLGWTYDFQFMSTFIPTIAKQALPGVPVVTRFENVGGAGPQTNSMVSRIIRKTLATCDPAGHVDYHFGTLLRDSDTILLLSGAHETVIAPCLPNVGRKCVLMPPPANMCLSSPDAETRRRGRKLLDANVDDFVFAYIGFVYPGKGIETLLHAFKRVVSGRGHVRLAVIGGSLAREFPDQPNYLERMQSLAGELGIGGHVVWTGEYRWDDDQASTYLRAADVCVLPFDNGVMLNNSSFSSAAAHGLPIVTTKGPVLESPFVHRENVFLCAPVSADALAGAMESVRDDAQLRSRLSAGALQLTQKWYSWDAAIERTISLFTSLSKQAAGGHGMGSTSLDRQPQGLATTHSEL